MEKAKMFDMALDKMLGELDDIEGHGAMSHSLEECPDPMNCDMHDGDLGENLAPEKQEEGSPAAVEITVHKMGMPSMDGKSDSKAEEDHLSPEEAEELRKLLK